MRSIWLSNGAGVSGFGASSSWLQLGKRASRRQRARVSAPKHPEHRAAFGCRCVDALLGDVQADASLA
jgi:hypothetical protein